MSIIKSVKSHITTLHPGTIKAIVTSLSVVLAAIAILFINPPLFTDDDSSNAITGTAIASDTTLSISLSTPSLTLDLTPTSASGIFATTADDTTGNSTAVIHVATNNITGYTLGIKAGNPASSTADKLISSNEKCEDTPTFTRCSINSLTSPVSKEDYITNTVEGVDLNNTWGYAPSYYNSIPNTTTTTTQDPNTNEDITTTSIINYYPAPVQGDTIATTSAPNQEDTTANDGTLLADEYTIDYGIRIDYTPYSGSYSTAYNNQSYIITAVGNLVPYSVSYNANKPDQAPETSTVDNMPTAQAGNVQGGDTVAVLLSQKVPTIGTTNPTTGDYTSAGYVFNGWCTVKPQVPAEIDGYPNTHGYQVCPVDQQQSTQPTQSAQPDQTPARLFQPGDNFGIDQTVDNTQILYATWGAPAIVQFEGNGLYYDNDEYNTGNVIYYIPTYEDDNITNPKTNSIYIGAYIEPTPLTTPVNYTFKGWSTNKQATEATYTNEQDIANNLTLNADDNITLYAIWTYTTIITFDGNGADSGTMEPITVEAGQTETLPQNTFTKTNYYFAGWNTKADGTGASYKNKSDYTAESGSNDITLHVKWIDCAPNHICYNDNGANSPITMSDQTYNYAESATPISSDSRANLWPMNYKYDTNNDSYNDYGFAGWSEDKDAASKILDADPDNNPTIYGPNQNITLGDISTAGLRLYAVWIPVVKSSANTELTFQTANLLATILEDGTTLASKPIGYVTALKDQRDNQVYAVAKLADGNYWMIENLRLDDSAVLNSVNTNNPNSDFTGLAASSDSWCRQSDSSCVNQSKLNTNNTTKPVEEMIDEEKNIVSYGNYYSWYSATTGRGTYEKTSGGVEGDICPAGWRLPLGNNALGSFYRLNKKINNDTDATDTGSSRAWRSFPNNFIFSGEWEETLAYYRGYGGYYWSSSAHSTKYAYHSYLNSGFVNPDASFLKNFGYSVRCVQNQ